jgi:tRNA (guanine-N7-)-methyltransferase
MLELHVVPGRYLSAMSRRNKLQKFAEVSALENVFENFEIHNDILSWRGQQVSMSGRWASGHFKNSNPVTLELACGKGEYTVGLAQQFPDRNFIGVDIKGARIWKGARNAAGLGLTNAAFLRTRIEHLRQFFAEGEIAELWIVFPDPFPRDSKANRRLTAPPFLEIYKKILKPGGIVHLKTDDAHLFSYSLEVATQDPKVSVLYSSEDIYAQDLPSPELGIQTCGDVANSGRFDGAINSKRSLAVMVITWFRS